LDNADGRGGRAALARRGITAVELVLVSFIVVFPCSFDRALAERQSKLSAQ
jgi:hypothetical protein